MNNYSAYPSYPPPPSAQTSTLAIVSLISGIVSWVLLPGIAAILAVITGHMAKSEIRQSLGRLSGEGLATAGQIMGYLNLALMCCLCLLALVLIILPAFGFMLLGPNTGNIFSNIIELGTPVP